MLESSVSRLWLACWPAVPFTALHATLQHHLPGRWVFLVTSSAQSVRAAFTCWVLSLWRVWDLAVGYTHLVWPTCWGGLPGFGCCRMLAASWSHIRELDVGWTNNSWRGAQQECCPLPHAPTPQGNHVTCVKRHGSWSDHFGVIPSGWPGQKIVSIQLLLREVFQTLCNCVAIIAATVC